VKVMVIVGLQARNRFYLGRGSRFGGQTTAIERQSHLDAGPLVRFARHGDCASLHADETAHDREAKAGSLLLPVRYGFGLKEGIAEMGEIGFGNSYSRIRHQDQEVM